MEQQGSVTSERAKSMKYGASTTHWDKIIPRITLGGGGECPPIVVGIEPERINGFERVLEAYAAQGLRW
jgi:hypothetical protein